MPPIFAGLEAMTCLLEMGGPPPMNRLPPGIDRKLAMGLVSTFTLWSRVLPSN